MLDNKPKEVFDKVVIICPDPWPKEKHHKRRLINDEFLSIVKRTMKNDSEIYISTDWENYAESIYDSFDRSDFVIKENLKKKNDFSKFEERGIKEEEESTNSTTLKNKFVEFVHKILYCNSSVTNFIFYT